MDRHTKHSIGRNAAALIAVTFVFGLTILMIFQRFEPAVITTVVTATSLGAAELVRQLQKPCASPAESEPRREVDS